MASAGLVIDDLDAASVCYAALLQMVEVERDSWRAPTPLEDRAVGLIGRRRDAAGLEQLPRAVDRVDPDGEHQPQHVAVPRTRPGGRRTRRSGAHERGLGHLAIEVDDVPGALARLNELGDSKMADPVTISDDGAGAVYCRDPFGTIIEFMSTGATMASWDDL